jgi:hypothetical protein
VRSSFEEFIETNLMVQSKFNLVFWFVSYNIFFVTEKSKARCCTLSHTLSVAAAASRPLSRGVSAVAEGRYVRLIYRMKRHTLIYSML